MGGTGSGGFRATAGRKTKLAAALQSLDPSQSTMHSFTIWDPKVVEMEAKQHGESCLAEEADTKVQQQASIKTVAEQAKIQDENRCLAINSLKKVMGDVRLEEPLDSLPDDSNDVDDADDESDNDESSPSRLSSAAYTHPKDSPLYT